MRVSIDADAVMQIFAQKKAAREGPCVLNLYEHQVEFSVPGTDRHFWSPFLNLIVETGAGTTTLYGKYGPNVNVWTMFVAGYAILFLTAVAGFFIGTSQMQLDQPLTGFHLMGGCAAAAAVVYAIGLFGRYLARPQMVQFHECIERWFADHILEIADEEAD